MSAAYERPSYLSPSGAESLARCPALYELGHLLRLREPGYIPPLALGKACHEATRHLREDSLAIAHGPEAAIQAGLAHLQHPGEDTARDQAKLRAMIEAYSMWVPPLRGELNEVPLSAPITHNGQVLTWAFGYADGLVRNDGQLWVYELKTTSGSLRETESTVRASLQPWVYLRAAELAGLKPAGVLLDIIKKPTIRTRKNESPEQWGRRAYDAYRDEPAKYFARPVIDYDESLIAEAFDRLAHLAQLQAYHLKHGFKATPGPGCKGPYGWCRYRPLCWFGDCERFTTPQGESNA